MLPQTLRSLFHCPNHCQWQMNLNSIHERIPGKWRASMKCLVCQTQIERSLPAPSDSAELSEWLKSLRRMLRARSAGAN